MYLSYALVIESTFLTKGAENSSWSVLKVSFVHTHMLLLGLGSKGGISLVGKVELTLTGK